MGILRIPAAAGIFHQGFLSRGLEYLTEIPAATCVLVCSLVMARIEKISLSDYGLSLHQGAGKHFLWGLFWGLCVFSAVILVVAALHPFSSGTSRARSFEVCKLMGACLSAGRIREEFLYRGYVQFTLAQAIGFWPASIVWSLVFNGMH
jgi:membrane protease YdiL (CAAX protease family)